MSSALAAGLIIAGVVALIIIIPLLTKLQFKHLPIEQQIRILMKQAKGLVYFKNITSGSKGTLVYIKNKRKIYTYPWVLSDGKMLCTRKNLFDKWDYPNEEDIPFTEEEKQQALSELENYNKKAIVKIYLNDD